MKPTSAMVARSRLCLPEWRAYAVAGTGAQHLHITSFIAAPLLPYQPAETCSEADLLKACNALPLQRRLPAPPSTPPACAPFNAACLRPDPPERRQHAVASAGTRHRTSLFLYITHQSQPCTMHQTALPSQATPAYSSTLGNAASTLFWRTNQRIANTPLLALAPSTAPPYSSISCIKASLLKQ